MKKTVLWVIIAIILIIGIIILFFNLNNKNDEPINISNDSDLIVIEDYVESRLYNFTKVEIDQLNKTVKLYYIKKTAENTSFAATIYLYDANDELIDSLVIPELNNNQSFATVNYSENLSSVVHYSVDLDSMPAVN